MQHDAKVLVRIHNAEGVPIAVPDMMNRSSASKHHNHRLDNADGKADGQTESCCGINKALKVKWVEIVEGYNRPHTFAQGPVHQCAEQLPNPGSDAEGTAPGHQE